MPVEKDDETVRLALSHSDITESLNREILKVTALPAGRYRLRIDSEVVGTFGARKLARGVNLALLKTPMSAQAQRVLDLTYRRNHLRFARIRIVEDALREYHPAKLEAAVEALEALEREVLALQRAAAIPEPHSYRLERVIWKGILPRK